MILWLGTVSKFKCSYLLSEILHVYDMENLEPLAFQIEFCGMPVKGLKTKKN
jgi:hypothetical protein